jgi:hypothetical protein
MLGVLLKPMTREERAEVERLCGLIQDEKDDDKFVNLIYQLDSLFKRKERRLNGDLLPTDKPPAW